MTDQFSRRPATPADMIDGNTFPPPVSVAFEPGPRRVRARVRGEIDMDDAGGLREDLTAALRASSAGLDVDLGAVTFCDSSGLHVLLDLNRLAAETGKSLVLTTLSRPVARLLQVTGSRRLLTVREPSAAGSRVGGHPVTALPGRPLRPAHQAGGAPRGAAHRPHRHDPDPAQAESSPGATAGGESWPEGLPDICDLCRRAIPVGATVYGHAADSSFAHPFDPEQDGNRPLLACSPAHLADLQQQYRSRPFVDTELWAVKIDNAMRRHRYGLSIDRLCEETGLSLIQVEAAVTWRRRPGRT
ncbi:STAS domain-containing protein [Streptomyces sp. NPDC085614]|uniref:STAS domain-containing protein n=1 Tax=Streptomyces sp. NPDC085614 TaxID=3365733 RepID=UPI0037D5260E